MFLNSSARQAWTAHPKVFPEKEALMAPASIRRSGAFFGSDYMCSSVCPHGVFVTGERRAELKKPEACMECGACQLNCPVDAIAVDSGVGCAAAMMRAALKGKKLEEASCGCTG
jgi:NAD-dependent dihydropyrimidine dehydrogenase PreA subunit